jgi:hypothetical protein
MLVYGVTALVPLLLLPIHYRNNSNEILYVEGSARYSPAGPQEHAHQDGQRASKSRKSAAYIHFVWPAHRMSTKNWPNLNSNERRRPEEDFASREEAIEQCVSVLMSIARDAFNLCAHIFAAQTEHIRHQRGSS